ncbi:BlaI/MecI/CopY family transcriptional regulator [Woodsholea maritima]|uniref:BlaI/MecI/CopY family transcriptional regulator n=1 Tax=Woodsholea maritima TaxID=240237 RepID=UPI00035D7630|nr:BlaI/MecI/CopY family transcriptional regulator [Woodsholea maritima]
MQTAPSPSEMAILKVLWHHGPQSAREVQDQIGAAQDWSYSTTRTLLTRMAEKGLIAREAVHGLAVFTATYSKAKVLSAMVRTFSAQVFDLDAPIAASAFAESPLLSADDLAELEGLLNEPTSQGEGA